jgi:hypothetical protein
VISVVIPTISGREHWLGNCIHAYERCSGDIEIITVTDRETCGEAWAEGGKRAQGDFIHFTADDIEPHDGWDEAAIHCAMGGALPSARILSTDGSLQSCGIWGAEMPEGTETDIARVPFLTREWWELGNWCLPAHYYTDNWISKRGQQLGIPTKVCRDYLFTHHYAPEGRVDARIDADRAIFDAYAA